MIKVSIIVPVYNGEKYISKCLETLLSQSLKDIEVIVVNDGSTDDTLNIINNFNDNRLKVISISNQGQGVARNIGVKYASGTYLGFVDSDDYVDNNMFNLMYEAMEQNDCDLVVCPYYRVNSENKIIYTEMIDCVGDYLNINTSPWNKLYKRDLWLSNNIKFAENLWYEDLEAVICYLSICNKVNWINNPLYYYVQRENSSINIYNSKIEDIFAVLDQIYFYTNNHVISVDKQIIEYYFIMHLVFGHLSRYAVEKSFLKRHTQIKKTKKYLKDKFPMYTLNKYFTWRVMNKSPFFLFIIKYVGFRIFIMNLYDFLLLIYRIRLTFNKNIQRW